MNYPTEMLESLALGFFRVLNRERPRPWSTMYPKEKEQLMALAGLAADQGAIPEGWRRGMNTFYREDSGAGVVEATDAALAACRRTLPPNLTTTGTEALEALRDEIRANRAEMRAALAVLRAEKV